jgi:hypothetical protein
LWVHHAKRFYRGITDWEVSSRVVEKEESDQMTNRLLARRAFTLGILGALMAALLIGPAPVTAAGTGTIVFDYSHGQTNSNLVNTTDLWLANNLTDLGYTVVWAKGGINSSVLEGAVGFVAGSMYGTSNGYTSSELSAIEDWYADGRKFVWIGYDSDYGGNQYIFDNMSAILEPMGSHVYGEPLSVEDPESNAGAGYRAVATVTSDDSFVASIVEGVEAVLMHGPTCLYGSDSDTPGVGVEPVALETEEIANVYPFLYYSPDATIVNGDLIDGYVHDEGDEGSFVAATIEINAGETGDNVIIVTGASPYGDYRPMFESEYYDVELSEMIVPQAIDFGMNQAQAQDMTLIIAIGAIGAVVVVIIIIAVMRRK